MTFGAIQAMQESLKHNQRPRRKGFKKWRDKAISLKPRNKFVRYGKVSKEKVAILKKRIARDKRISFIKQTIILVFIIILVASGFYLLFNL